MALISTKWCLDTIDSVDRQISDNNFFLNKLGRPEVKINFKKIDTISLSEWCLFLSLLRSKLDSINTPTVPRVYFELRSDRLASQRGLPNREEIYLYRKKKVTSDWQEEDLKDASNDYRLAGYLEALDTSAALGSGKYHVVYGTLNTGDIQHFNYYGPRSINLGSEYYEYDRENENNTTIHPISLIDSNDISTCEKYLEIDEIRSWRNSMQERFKESTLFKSEFVWRVFCYELSINIVQHAKCAGFIGGRVLTNKNVGYLKKQFPSEFQKFISLHSEGILELCISDAGVGIYSTLANVGDSNGINYVREKKNVLEHELDIIQYAFDEFGTCKLDKNEQWSIHALSRILHFIEKCAGILRIRSGHSELIYKGGEGFFTRDPKGYGYTADVRKILDSPVEGTHIQLLIPLYINPEFSSEAEKRRSSVFNFAYAHTFQLDEKHPLGQIVPIKARLVSWNYRSNLDISDALTNDEMKEFCGQLANEIRGNVVDKDPLIFDFSDITYWTASHVQKYFSMLKNLTQTQRPILGIELNDAILKSIKEDDAKNPSDCAWNNDYADVYETIPLVSITLDLYIIGLPNKHYVDAFIKMISIDEESENQAYTIDEIVDLVPNRLDKSVVEHIINRANPLFVPQKKDKRIRISWSSKQLSIQTKRVFNKHFSDVVSRCEAWRGRKAKDEKDYIFQLPWSGEWTADFLQSARILSRERNASEVAQRIIYYLKKELDNNKCTNRNDASNPLYQVKTLVCVTAPSFLLAHAIRKWWPLDVEYLPNIVDLGHYFLTNNYSEIPIVGVRRGGVVLVQDIIDRGGLSNKVVTKLEKEQLNILAVVAMVKTIQNERINSKSKELVKSISPIELALCEIDKPNSILEHNISKKQKNNSYWVEPRTLRPWNYDTLRFGGKIKKVNSLENSRLQARLDEINETKKIFDDNRRHLYRAGHYAFDKRHYSASIDINSLIDESKYGKSIIQSIADLCCTGATNNLKWVQDKHLPNTRYNAVLLPMHSHIHIIWEEVDRLVRLRGFRIHMWLLDATMFLGHGSAYRLPKQLEDQIERWVESMKENNNHPPMNILVLDDAMVTARTTQTVLQAIVKRGIDKKLNSIGVRNPINPVYSISYVCIFNLLNAANYEQLRWVEYMGKYDTPLNWGYYKRSLGLPNYDARACPNCQMIRRLNEVSTFIKKCKLSDLQTWVRDERKRIAPIAIDSQKFIKERKIELSRDILIIPSEVHGATELATKYADLAIVHFYELMYRSYPVGEVLSAMLYNYEDSNDNTNCEKEYDRYRYAVYDWCFRHWDRLDAFAARKMFFKCVLDEIKRTTNISAIICMRMADVGTGKYVKKLLEIVLERVLKLDTNSDTYPKPKYLKSDVHLRDEMTFRKQYRDRWRDISGALCLICTIKAENYKSYLEEEIDLKKLRNDLLERLINENDFPVGEQANKLIIPTLYKIFVWMEEDVFSLSKYERKGPALRVISQSLFRGINSRGQQETHHYLLYFLNSACGRGIYENDIRVGLSVELNSFLEALQNIFHGDYTLETEANEIVDELRDIIDMLGAWDRSPVSQEELQQQEELANNLKERSSNLNTYLSQGSNIRKHFAGRYHAKLGQLRKKYNEQYRAILKLNKNVGIVWKESELDNEYIIADQHSLLEFISNWTVQPILKSFYEKGKIQISAKMKDIEVNRIPTKKIVLKLETDFTTIDETNRIINGSKNTASDIEQKLRKYGLDIQDDNNGNYWRENSNKDGNYAEIVIPIGYPPTN